MTNEIIAAAAFNLGGLDAMGISSGQLSAIWATGTPVYDQSAMTLTLDSSQTWKVMAGGFIRWTAFGVPYLTDETSSHLEGTVGVLQIHPQAMLRLRRLAAKRYDDRSDGLSVRPFPAYIAVRNGAPDDWTTALEDMQPDDPPLAPETGFIGEELGKGGILSFHDEQGLIIDPVAVAVIFKDLLTTYNALLHSDGGDVADISSQDDGKLGKIAGLATGNRIHLINVFGENWDVTGNDQGIRIGSGPKLELQFADWPAGESITLSNAARSLRFGLSPEGTLSANELRLPAFPTGGDTVTLPRQFFRIMLVDLNLHLLGNRTDDELQGILGVDAETIREPLPVVREGDTIEFLTEGASMLGAVNETLSGTGFRLVVSPLVQPTGILPSTAGSKWPAFPAPASTAASLDAATATSARSAFTAAFATGSNDVVLTWPGGSLPAEAFVRVYPRVDPGPVLVPLAEMEFAKRGDGAAGIVQTAGALVLLLKDPFNAGTAPRPSNVKLFFDLLIVTRNGAVKKILLGGLEATMGADQPAPDTTGPANNLGSVPVNQLAFSPAPILGLTPPAVPTSDNPVLNDNADAAPREGTRFRTMARNETIVASQEGATPAWTAVLSAGWLRPANAVANARLGNPGNSAGPEESAGGIKMNGLLAQDLARAALRRTHHIIRRLDELEEDRWNSPASGTSSMAGAILQNIADTVETPGMSFIPDSGISTWPEYMSSVASSLPSSLSSLRNKVPTRGGIDRWVAEFKRVASSARIGRRDSLWALGWAISNARKLVYIETALFGSTDVEANEFKWDLVKLLKERLESARNLRLVLVIPKRVPFGSGYESFAQQFYKLRNEAIASLQAAAPKRVTVLHPVGFPGRPAIVRGMTAIVDDVWALCGSSTFSRRGLSFDGSNDVCFTDKKISGGSSQAIRILRRNVMARVINLSAPQAGESLNPNWTRLSLPVSAAELFREILDRGGDGLVEPLWKGIKETDLPAFDRKIADPDGRDFNSVAGLFASVLAALGNARV
ncbi:MAG: hypothetical protein EOO09_02385 [Chitinophagaceae bacterium]|nr:MAG: hypothetical protein EOO09_02385 [Chitinophagaceae bacterium]